MIPSREIKKKRTRTDLVEVRCGGM